jgi:hypothetical protein
MYSDKKTVTFSLIAMLVGLAVPFLMIELMLRFLPVTSSTGTMDVDRQNPVIRLTPNQAYTFSKGWQFAIVNSGRINNYGFVNDQDYASRDEQGPLVIVGDSYVEALMVPYEQTVQGRLAARLKDRLKVYSVGISGSQLAQYLAFAQYAGAEFHPRAMAFLIIGNDFDESLLKYKDGPGYHYFQEEGPHRDLTLVRRDYHPSLAKRLLRRSALVRYLWGTVGISDVTSILNEKFSRGTRYVGNTDAGVSEERLADSRRAVDQFFLELPQRIDLDKSRVTFIVDAIRPEIYSDDDLKGATGSYVGLMRQYFLQEAQRHGYEAIDMQPRFIARHRQDGTRFEFATDGHWNGLGHQEAAEAIASSRMLKAMMSQ